MALPDGNGRVGRTLLNYFLMINNHPPLIIYDEDKKEYYQSLQIYDEKEQLNELTTFFIKQTIKTWEKTILINKQNTKNNKKLTDFTNN